MYRIKKEGEAKVILPPLPFVHKVHKVHKVVKSFGQSLSAALLP